MLTAFRRPAPAKRVLLVGWDGADWKIASPLVDAGELPQLARIVEQGASGPLASLPPYLSPMLWNSIATGKYADRHGILGFTTTDPISGRLLPITSTQRRCKALWNILGEHGRTAHVVGWFASHPAENVTGVCVTEALPRPVARGAPWPVPAGAVHPPGLTDEFAGLRVRPEDVDPALLRLFVPRAGEIDLTQDRRLEQLAIRLAELYTVHNAAIAALDREPCDFLAVYYHFIDWVCHDFMDFHPPRRPNIEEREFELYRDVVNSAYRLQDLLLRDLLTHAGADSSVIVCSDHGFHSDVRRPQHIPAVSAGIAIWHRAQGLFAAAGPGLARDALVTGATVLDITPTILHLLGLPAAADMDGHVLASALPPGAKIPAKIPSYEDEPGPHPRPRHLGALTTKDEEALLAQFSALGYVDLADRGPDSPAARNDRDNRWNLALTLRHAGRHEAALALLDRLHLECPEDARYAFHLAMCLLHFGLGDEASAAAETIVDYTPGHASARLLLAEIDLVRENPLSALAHLDILDAVDTATASRLLLRGRILFKLGRIADACTTLHRAVDADDEDPSAWLAYAQALLHAGHPADAATCARQTLALAPTMAAAHFTLGQALAVQKQTPAARESFQRAAGLNPRLAGVSSALAQLDGRPFVAATGDLTQSVENSRRDTLRAEIRQRHAEHATALARLRATRQPLDQIVPRAKIPPASVATPAAASAPIVVVSGLPRSGTSLMMQMLARGGLPPFTDGRRAADISNPEGYFEWEEIKSLPRDPSLVARAAGHAVKIVSPLLAHLPRGYDYRIIFMTRPVEEVARSQEKLRARLEPHATDAPPTAAALARHQGEVLARLRATTDLPLLLVDYPALVAAPAAEARRVAAFLGDTLLPDATAMSTAVRAELHHEKIPSA